MEHPLDGVRLKLVRAEEHLRSLDLKIKEYFDSNPCEVVKKSEGKEVYFILSIREQPPPEFGPIIGDCLHNMRSALDHLLWQLLRFPLPDGVRANRLTFPIFLNEIAYLEAVSSNGLSRCVSEDALAIIKRMQPYHGGDWANMHALWVIHELSNRDKHRMIHTTVGAATSDHVVLTGTMNPTFFSGVINPGILEDGAELIRVPLALSPTERMKVNVRFRFFVALKEAEPWTDDAVTAYLDRCFDFLKNELVPAFEPLMDGKWQKLEL